MPRTLFPWESRQRYCRLNVTTLVQSICGFGRLATSLPLVTVRLLNCCPLSDPVVQALDAFIRAVLRGSGLVPSIVSTLPGCVPGLSKTQVKEAAGQREGTGTPSNDVILIGGVGKGQDSAQQRQTPRQRK